MSHSKSPTNTMSHMAVSTQLVSVPERTYVRRLSTRLGPAPGQHTVQYNAVPSSVLQHSSIQARAALALSHAPKNSTVYRQHTQLVCKAVSTAAMRLLSNQNVLSAQLFPAVTTTPLCRTVLAASCSAHPIRQPRSGTTKGTSCRSSSDAPADSIKHSTRKQAFSQCRVTVYMAPAKPVPSYSAQNKTLPKLLQILRLIVE